MDRIESKKNINVLDSKEMDLFLRQVLNIGEAMYRSGSEISRIEDTLRRLGKAYGAEHVNIYAITSSIVATIEFPNASAMTQSRRIRHRDSTNLEKLEQLNELCRECCAQPITIEELKSKVLSIINKPVNEMRGYLGQIIGASAFAVFFGGNAWDALVAGLVAILICCIQRFIQPYFEGRLFYNVFTSFVAGIAIDLVCMGIPSLHSAQIMIGDIMILIPGIAITNSIRYTLSGDSISGIEKLIDSVLQGLGIAAGFTLALFLL